MEIKPIPETEMDHLVTPYFRHETIENVPQSEIHQRPVMELREIVELRFAGDKNYSPWFPADAMYRMEGHKVITYAERFAEQYRAFQEGAEQEAAGTPLERLAEYGITQAQLSLTRALKIYSIEALHALEDRGLKSLGMQANSLKAMAEAYMADRDKGAVAARQIEALQAEIAALRGAVIPADEKAELAKLPEGYEDMTDEELKEAILARSGNRPKGNPNRTTLIGILSTLEAA